MKDRTVFTPSLCRAARAAVSSLGLLAALAALGLPPAGAQTPRADVPFLEKSIRLDGKMDDAGWKNATPMPLGTVNGQPIENGPVAKMAWDRTYLYVGVDMPDTMLVASRSGHDDPIWERDDVLEIFLWPQEAQPYYYQVAVNPRGAIYDGFFISNATHTGAILSLPDWNPQIKAQARLSPASVFRPDRPGTPTEGGFWTVEMAIPIAALTSRPAGLPAPGETWRAQVVRFNRPDPAPGQLDAAAWAPYEDVTAPYLLDRFGTITFQGGPAPVIAPLVPGTGVSTQPSVQPIITPEPVVSPQPAVTPAPAVVTPPTPEQPATPATPEQPATPATPATPEQPATPATPATPEQPATPGQPATPATPPAETAPPAATATTTVTVSFTNVPIREALDTLFRGTGKTFALTPAVADKAPRVTAEVRSLPFDEALAAVLDAAGRQYGTTIQYTRTNDGAYVIFLKGGNPGSAPAPATQPAPSASSGASPSVPPGRGK